MLRKFSDLQEQIAHLESAGQKLTLDCEGEIFPCDCLALSVLSRTFNLIKGFSVLVEKNSYVCAVPLLRLQLDSILRFYGVITCKDPHDVAGQLLGGKALKKIKHSSGRLMQDSELIKHLSIKIPELKNVYEVCSGYIHLSDTEFFHLLEQSKYVNGSTFRQIRLCDNNDYLPPEFKEQLIHNFVVVTKGVLSLVNEWTSVRQGVTDPDLIKKKYQPA